MQWWKNVSTIITRFAPNSHVFSLYLLSSFFSYIEEGHGMQMISHTTHIFGFIYGLALGFLVIILLSVHFYNQIRCWTLHEIFQVLKDFNNKSVMEHKQTKSILRQALFLSTFSVVLGLCSTPWQCHRDPRYSRLLADFFQCWRECHFNG